MDEPPHYLSLTSPSPPPARCPRHLRRRRQRRLPLRAMLRAPRAPHKLHRRRRRRRRIRAPSTRCTPKSRVRATTAHHKTQAAAPTPRGGPLLPGHVCTHMPRIKPWLRHPWPLAALSLARSSPSPAHPSTTCFPLHLNCMCSAPLLLSTRSSPSALIATPDIPPSPQACLCCPTTFSRAARSPSSRCVAATSLNPLPTGLLLPDQSLIRTAPSSPLRLQGVSENMQVMHSINLGPKTSSYHFAPTYVGTKKISPTQVRGRARLALPPHASPSPPPSPPPNKHKYTNKQTHRHTRL